ncbi:uncharacterized protein LOC128957752 [Oppia nitens]|uniref:uncharacterized protein LOC128957752 n=1 Tax=Oppia nitens TaxID=1686743 RepID=UPI0023DBAA15|nr:uncharacterized protein LOC128957752 [Oppia nitens]
MEAKVKKKLVIITEVDGHGRLIDPASRSSAWRFGFKTEINYNDNQLFCGGFTTHWNVNKGKCGVCGDPYNGQRDNEVPNGKYAKQLVITRTYRSGDTIDVKIQITTNHRGFFEFGLCPALSKTVEVSQQCLDKYRPRVLNSQTSDKYIVPTNRAETYRIRLKLPDGLVCDRCVFQWSYTAGNNWGVCANGTGAVGCGPQETFRGCADVRIVGRPKIFGNNMFAIVCLITGDIFFSAIEDKLIDNPFFLNIC